MSKYRDLSNREFVDLLRSKLQNASWNVGEMIELEDRGMEILSAETDLYQAISMKKEEFTKSINRAMEPYSKQFQQLSESVNNFKNLKLTSPTFSIPKIQMQPILSPEVAEVIAKSNSEQMAKLMLIELRKISHQSSRDWFQWVIFMSTIVAAFSSMLALLFF